MVAAAGEDFFAERDYSIKFANSPTMKPRPSSTPPPILLMMIIVISWAPRMIIIGVRCKQHGRGRRMVSSSNTLTLCVRICVLKPSWLAG